MNTGHPLSMFSDKIAAVQYTPWQPNVKLFCLHSAPYSARFHSAAFSYFVLLSYLAKRSY